MNMNNNMSRDISPLTAFLIYVGYITLCAVLFKLCGVY